MTPFSVNSFHGTINMASLLFQNKLKYILIPQYHSFWQCQVLIVFRTHQTWTQVSMEQELSKNLEDLVLMSLDLLIPSWLSSLFLMYLVRNPSPMSYLSICFTIILCLVFHLLFIYISVDSILDLGYLQTIISHL